MNYARDLHFGRCALVTVNLKPKCISPGLHHQYNHPSAGEAIIKIMGEIST